MYNEVEMLDMQLLGNASFHVEINQLLYKYFVIKNKKGY